VRAIDEPAAGGIYQVAKADVDGDAEGTTVELTVTNLGYGSADVSLLPPNARKALIRWLDIEVAEL
jgi:hypothetical protein